MCSLLWNDTACDSRLHIVGCTLRRQKIDSVCLFASACLHWKEESCRIPCNALLMQVSPTRGTKGSSLFTSIRHRYIPKCFAMNWCKRARGAVSNVFPRSHFIITNKKSSAKESYQLSPLKKDKHIFAWPMSCSAPLSPLIFILNLKTH